MARINLVTSTNKKFLDAEINDIQIFGSSGSRMFIGPENCTNCISIGENTTTMANVTITGDQTCKNVFIEEIFVKGGIFNEAGQSFASSMIQGNVQGVPELTAYGGAIKVSNDPNLKGGTLVDSATRGVRSLDVYSGSIKVTNNTNVQSTITSTLGVPEMTIYGGNLTTTNFDDKIEGAYVPKYIGGVEPNMSFDGLYVSNNVGINVENPFFPLEVNGTIRATNVTETSDIRVKENVIPLYCNRDILKQLRPVLYNYIDDDTKTQKAGLIAQEVEKILPSLVSTSVNWLPVREGHVFKAGDTVKLRNGTILKYDINDRRNMFIKYYEVNDFKSINYSTLAVHLLAAFLEEK